MRASSEDMERIGRILGGDRRLFHELIRPYERSVYMSAFSVLRDPAEAEDVAQETMLKAYRALARFRGDSKFSTWLISIAIREAYNRRRGRGSVVLESLDTAPEGKEYLPYLLADWREIPSEVLERRELAEHIERAIQNLPVAHREAFLLRDKEGLSIEEIAEATGAKANLIKVRLFRARMHLQKELAPYLKLQAAPPRRWFPGPGGRP